jgi:putative transposase
MHLQGMVPGPHTSQGIPHDPKWPCLLNGLRIERINQVWATDLTYLRIPQGFVYLVALIDVYSRYIVSYQVSVTMDAEFCVRMAEEAFLQGSPELFHSDQGSQFTCAQMTCLLLEKKVLGSMTGKGRCIDNIYIERFWRSFKYEDLYLKDYASVKEARASIGKYIQFYNERRLHQHLHYQTPQEVYERRNKKTIEAFVYKQRTQTTVDVGKLSADNHLSL